ncbi:hypothetical protein C8J57DRAFT_1239838 [Mycena rebaudengoi]|nr:hypothetical protein C8J57DRAFT_1239838 [Mycena rebaudengoi]
MTQMTREKVLLSPTESPETAKHGINWLASTTLSRIDKRNSDVRVRRLPKSPQIDWNLGIFRVRSERTETEAIKEVLLTAEMNDPLNGRVGDENRAIAGPSICGENGHPFDGCCRAVPTVTGGSPTPEG